MKNTLLLISTLITSAAASTSIYISTLPSPNDSQKELGNTANTVFIAGATTVFGLLNDNNDRDDDIS